MGLMRFYNCGLLLPLKSFFIRTIKCLGMFQYIYFYKIVKKVFSNELYSKFHFSRPTRSPQIIILPIFCSVLRASKSKSICQKERSVYIRARGYRCLNVFFSLNIFKIPSDVSPWEMNVKNLLRHNRTTVCRQLQIETDRLSDTNENEILFLLNCV